MFRRPILTVVAGCLILAVVPVAAATSALAQPTGFCLENSCGGGGGGGNPPPPPPKTQTIGQDLTAITAFTNTGASCTFGFPVVTTTFATLSSAWTASVQCTEQVADIAGKTAFDTWYFPGSAVACTDGQCGGVEPDHGAGTGITFSGSANLAPNVSYGVQAEYMITAPPGQVWVSGDAVVSSGPWFFCRPESFPGEPANNTYLCEQDTGPFSAP